MTDDELLRRVLRERAAMAPDPEVVVAAGLRLGRRRRTRRRVAGVVAATGIVLGGVALLPTLTSAERVPAASGGDLEVVDQPGKSLPGRPIGGLRRGEFTVEVRAGQGGAPVTWPDDTGREVPLGPPDKDGVRSTPDGRVLVRQQDPRYWVAAMSPNAPADVIRIGLNMTTTQWH